MKTDLSSYKRNPHKLPSLSESPAGEPPAVHCTTVVRGRDKASNISIDPLVLPITSPGPRDLKGGSYKLGWQASCLISCVGLDHHAWLLMASRVKLGSDSSRHLRGARRIDVREDPFVKGGMKGMAIVPEH